VKVGPEYVEGLIPFVHVREVVRSTTFYENVGFKVHNTYEKDGRRSGAGWSGTGTADTRRGRCARGRLGTSRAVLGVRPRAGEELRGQLAKAGLEPGPIEPGAPGPDRVFGISVPDG
jgi:hypothetical protein